jgi:lysophospholipase L1-like esterase
MTRLLAITFIVILFSCRKVEYHDQSLPDIQPSLAASSFATLEETLYSDSCSKPVRIVILGSSSAAGYGATPKDSGWAFKYKRYLQRLNPSNEVINLGTGGYTTYQVLNPNNYVPPSGRPKPDINKNITKALSFNPNAIIINLPSNDIASGYSFKETKANYERALALAANKGVPVWVTTTQPRNLTAALRDSLKAFRDWTLERFGEFALNFWTPIATSSGTIISQYNADGIHTNNAGHELLFRQIANKLIVGGLCGMLNESTANTIPAKIESENLYAWSGIELFNTSDAGGGKYVGSIDSGDWLDYKLQISEAGKYSMVFRYATSSTGSKFNIGYAGGNVLAVFAPRSTGGNQVWRSDSIELRLPVGEHVIRVQSAGSICNLNWYQFRFKTSANVPPVVNAGANKTITLPVNSIQLNGTATDADGTISSIQWTKISGPSFEIIGANTLNPMVSGLQEGTYIFQLTATDDSSATASDEIQLTVQPEPAAPVGGQQIKVNIYGGVNAYNNSEWNNWNTSSSLTSAFFRYSDGGASTVRGLLSSQQGVSDNSTPYPVTMAPVEVGRYASNASVDRTLTLSGLDNSKTYTLEIFCSRRGSIINTTRFTYNGTTVDINATNNYSNIVRFTLFPVNGNVVISITRLNTYNYVNGFILKEN